MHRTIIALAALAAGALVATPAAAQEIEHRANTRGLFVNGHFNGSSAKYDGGDGGEDATETGGGGGFQVGYGLNRNFTLYVGYDASRLSFGQKEGIIEDEGFRALLLFEDKYWLKQLELGGRYNFVSPTRTWVPYVDLAYTLPSGGSDFRVFVDDDEDPATDPRNDDGVAGEDDALEGEFELEKGGAMTFGAGVTYFFSQKLALDVNLKYSAVKFDEMGLTLRGPGGSFSDTIDEETKFGLTRLNFGFTWYPLLGR